jgi:hypothetical protein
MAAMGRAALAMWWDVSAALRSDFEHWHTHEHFPERLGVPGFRRASRWTSADGGEGFFVLYELDDHAMLGSPAYLARLNAPTPWTTRLMPEHRNMVRSQCRVLESRGLVTARQALTIRLSPAPGREEDLRAALRARIERLPHEPGLAGAHLLRHQNPPLAPTEEQRLRGHADRVADWVLIVCGYEAQALRALSHGELADASLHALGAAAGAERGLYALSCSAITPDVLSA